MKTMIDLKYILGFAVIITSLSSCGIITKTYKSATPYELEQFRQESPSDDTSSLAQYNWKEIFTDQLLQNYIDSALINNLDLLQAEERINIAQSYLRQSKAAFAPSIGVQADYGYSNPSLASFNGRLIPERLNVNDIKVDGFLSWELDIWGKIRSQRNASRASFNASESMVNLVKSQLVANVAANYFTLLSLDKKRKVLLEIVENRIAGVETIKALKEAGSVTEVAVKQNEALLYNAQSLLISIENQIKLQENALSILLAKSPQTIVRDSLDNQYFIDEIKTGVPIQLLSNRPDVLASEFNLISAFEMTNVARASFFPSISINGMLGVNSQNFSDLFSLNALFANVLGNITQPIFNQRKLRTMKEVRVSEQEIAFLNYKATVLDAYREVSDAVYSYNAFNEKFLIKEQENEALHLAVDYSEDLQRQGMANYLEVIVAKNTALNTELEMIDMQLNKLTSTVSLYRALGGGWKE